MSIRTGLFAASFVALGVVALAPTTSVAQPDPSFPFDVTLTRALGFRTSPSLEGGFVFSGRNYLQPPAKLKLLRATGPLWRPGTFCEAEHAGKTGYIRCDDKSAMAVGAASTTPTAPPAPTSTPAQTNPAGAPQYKSKNSFGVSCGNTMEACTEFCKQACDILPSGGAHCPRVPGGEGLLPESSPLLKDLPRDLKYVKTDRGDKGTSETIEGLRRLDAWLASSPDRAKYNYTVHVSNCWRDGIVDSQKECYFIMKGKDPRDLKLAMPGATPHSSGKACDVHLIDAGGKNAVPSSACTADAQTGSSIDFKTASRLLDEAMTNDKVNAQRLNYEAWHYEWGGAVKDDDCRCKAPECQQKFWPPSCTPRGCKAH